MRNRFFHVMLLFGLTAVAAPPSLAAGLNDTGIQFCGEAGSGNNEPCTGSEPEGQDAHYGRDAAAAAETLNKSGGGGKGFDFTKIANSGAVLPPGADLGDAPNDWACTRDNVTGLVWEVKVNSPNHFRHREHSYTWYDPDSPDGKVGSSGNTSTCNNTLAGNSCNTANYVVAVNAAGLCGYGDWRMPTRQELAGLVDYGRVNPAIDPDYFPNTSFSLIFFWSGTSYFYDLDWDGFAWSVSFANGRATKNWPRSDAYYVRVVR